VPSAPGGFTVRPDGSITDVSASARAWLDVLDDRRRIPAAIRCVVAAARTRPDAAVVSVPSPVGAFVTLYGSAVEHSGSVNVIIEPSRTTVISDMWAHAYRLTARERQVAREVALGKSTRDIARTLGISPFTVTDHLKALYAKTGVASRSELVAALNRRQNHEHMTLAAGLARVGYLDQYHAAPRTA
jgi:DNA-binding CsgD family transcriptional regulator